MTSILSGVCLLASLFAEPNRLACDNGAEFPGAQGHAEVVQGALEMAYDFSGGGHYVRSRVDLGEPTVVREVSLEASFGCDTALTLRAQDATGQVFQQRLSSPTEENAWERRAWVIETATAHWGGANDGVVHQPVRALAFLAENLTCEAPGGSRGVLKVRNVELRETTSAERAAADGPARDVRELMRVVARLREGLAERLRSLEERGLGAKTRATVTVMELFENWVGEDLSQGRTNRAVRALRELESIARVERERLDRVASGEAREFAVPRFVTSPVETKGADIWADRVWPDGRRERGRVMLTGFGHFDRVQRELDRLPLLGNSILQMEIGPRSVLPTETTVNTNALKPFFEVAARAARENVQVCLLLSPHYFPDWAFRKWPDLKGCGRGFFKYCVHDPRAQAVIEKSLRAVIPLVRGTEALHSVVLSNEPEQGCWASNCILRTEWPRRLAKTFGTVAQMNAAWKTKYAAFADVPAPKDFTRPTATPETLAFVRFSRSRFADFHRRMARVVRELAPELPLHVKVMGFAEFENSATYHSVDIEDFSRMSDYNGNDAYDLPATPGDGLWAHAWWEAAAVYDWQRSCKDVPVFNSENHLVSDFCGQPVSGRHFYTALWQNALHGQAATTLWLWERTSSPKHFAWGSVLERPDCLNAWAHGALDLSRLADELAPIRNQDPTLLLHFSLSSQILSGRRGEAFLATYRAASFLGQPLGVVTERMLSDYGRTGVLTRPLVAARAVLLPDSAAIPSDVRKGLDRLSRRGVEVVECAGSDRAQFRQLSAASSGWGLPAFPRVHAADSGQGVFGVESRGARVGDAAFVSFVNHTQKPLRIRLEAPGADLITGEAVPASFELPPLAPMFVRLEASCPAVTNARAQVRVGGRPGLLMEAVVRERLTSKAARTTIYDEAERAFETHWDDSRDENGRVRNGWQNEYWGKTMLCAAEAIAATGDPDLRRWALEKAHAFVRAHQRPNGYLSTYAEEDALGVRRPGDDPGKTWNFNIWGRKYTMWALVALFRATGDPVCLSAAERMADHLCAQLKRLGVGIEWTGSWAGLSSMTVLKPLLLVYCERPKAEYLELARHIVAVNDRDGSSPLQMNLIRNALSDRPVSGWFGNRAIFLSKAYEMMSFFEGVAEYHRVTGDSRARAAVKAFHRHLADEELDPMRSVGYFDHFLNARRHVNGMTELCDVIHWMRLNRELFLLTGETRYLDFLEEAFYNAFLAGVAPDGSWAAHIVRSHGTRHLSAPPQTGMLHHQCCTDNMPRGFFDWASTVVTQGPGGALDLNLLGDAQAEIDGVRIEVSGNYPVSDTFRVRVRADRPVCLRLRVPGWSPSVAVDGVARVPANGRVALDTAGRDTVWTVSLDLSPRLLPSSAPEDEDISVIPGQADWHRPSYAERYMSWLTPEMETLARRTHAAQVMRGPLVLAKGRVAGTSRAETLDFETVNARGWTAGALVPMPRTADSAAAWGAWTLELRRGAERRFIPVADYWSASCANDPGNWFSLWF